MLREKLTAYARIAAYRWPVLRDIFRPRYHYQLQPPELVWLCNAIERTRGAGCIVEVGVSRGKTTVFLLEFMRTTFDARPYVCIDTFRGFLPEHVAHEIEQRGKRYNGYDAFRFTHRQTFERNVSQFRNCRVIEADAAEFDWASIAPIAVMLVDVDLYLPTKATLEDAWPHLLDAGAILVDNAEPDKPYDGAYQALCEFCEARDMTFREVGTRGGAIVKKL